MKTYQFLWFTESGYRVDNGAGCRERNVKAKSLKSALMKFYNSIPKTLFVLDYEVLERESDKYHDISGSILSKFI